MKGTLEKCSTGLWVISMFHVLRKANISKTVSIGNTFMRFQGILIVRGEMIIILSFFNKTYYLERALVIIVYSSSSRIFHEILE